MATKKAVKPRASTAVRRREILAAAMDIFGSKGTVNGTLADIAERVGMTHAGILHHFGSKDQLVLEVLSYRDTSDVEQFDDKHIPDGVELFRHLVRTVFANERRQGIVAAYAVLSAESVTDDNPSRGYFVARYTTLRAEIAHAFEVMCEERGIAVPETIDRATVAILGVMDGLQVQWLLDPENVELAKSSEFAIEAIVSSVLDPRPSCIKESDSRQNSQAHLRA